MNELHRMQCQACQAGAPTVSEHEAAELLKQIPGWSIIEDQSVQKLQRVFTFDDFAGALDFTNRLGELAEEHSHHPAIVTEWGKVTVTWWTHKIKGLHKTDFILAAKTDRL